MHHGVFRELLLLFTIVSTEVITLSLHARHLRDLTTVVSSSAGVEPSEPFAAEAMGPADTGLLAIIAMLIIPNFTLIHPYLHLLIMAPLLVFTGCHRALLEAAKGSESQVQERSRPPARVPAPSGSTCCL